MNANVHYTEDGEPSSLTVNGERTKWYFRINESVALFTRVEVDKDDHSTDDATVLFSGEWVDAMEFVKALDCISEVELQESL